MIFNISGGGGAVLNFKVLAYDNETELLAATPPENTIGIITETPITSWIFSSSKPSPAVPGMVWIYTDTSSYVEFNALKKNALQVYPQMAQQYIDSAWVDKTTKSYLGSRWVNWWNGELYDAGNEYTNITGGWIGANYSTGSTATGGSIKGTDCLTTSNVNNGTWGATIANAVNMSRFNTLYVTANAAATVTMDINIADDFPTDTSDNSVSKSIGTTKTTVSVPIDTITENKKVHIRCKSTTTALNIYKVWME